VLGAEPWPWFDAPDAVVDVEVEVRVCGLGSTTTVLVVLLQALRAQRPAPIRASRFKGASSEKVGPNVVFPMVDVGLIETMRAREGRLPWLGRHLARLRASVATLGLAAPAPDIADLARIAAGAGERVVRLELRGGHVEVSTRDVVEQPTVALVVSDEPYRSYPHKTTRREQFGRALAHARRIGAHDALLVSADGYVAEGTAWSLFWWDNGSLFTPAQDLGILPGIGRRRIMELTGVNEARVQVTVLAGKSMFLVNAVRGVVEIDRLQGEPLPRDPRTAELSSAFWPD
jgi:branched-subunit amino acid aminotransferase/4-amino-4-deoxychorismate lyase